MMCELASEKPQIFPVGGEVNRGCGGRRALDKPAPGAPAPARATGLMLPLSSSATPYLPLQGRLSWGASRPPRYPVGQSHRKGAAGGPVQLLALRPVASLGLQPQALAQVPQNSGQTQRDSGAGARGEGAAPRQEHLENELTPKSGVHLDKVAGLEGC